MPRRRPASKAGLLAFHEAWPLVSLRLDDNHSAHVARLQGELPSASAGRNAALKARLEKAEAAHMRLANFKIHVDEAQALPGCNTFISYIHGQPHSTRAACTPSQRPTSAL